MSTVGYGDLSPSTLGTKCFTCFYIIVGITVVFAQLAGSLSGVLTSVEKLVLGVVDRFDRTAKVSGHECGLSGNEVDIDDDGIVDFVAPPSAHVYWAQGLSCGVFLLLAHQLVSAAVFTWVEPDLSFDTAFYHCFVTATTVGYGDVALSTQQARLWAFFHIAVSVAWLAALISHVEELRQRRKAQLQRQRWLVGQLDADSIRALDMDNKGVDKLEFVVGMLIHLGVEVCGQPLEWKDVVPFIKRFKKVDKDGNGRLMQDDLAKMVLERKVTARVKTQCSLLADSDNGAQKYARRVAPDSSSVPPDQIT